MSIRLYGVIEAGALLGLFKPGDEVRKSKAFKYVEPLVRERLAR